MVWFITAVRVIHIFAGVFWAGAAIAMAAFITPAVQLAGPAGGTFMQKLAQHTRFSFFMNQAALLSALSGLVLFWIFSGGLQLAWITTGHGLGLTVGSIAGLVEFFMGLMVMRPTAERMGALGKEIQAGGGPPSTAQIAEMGALQKKLAEGGMCGAVLLAIAVFGMAVARYL